MSYFEMETKHELNVVSTMVDKIRSKLALWKAHILSIAGRVLLVKTLVKTVIHSMLLHTLLVYSRLISILSDMFVS